MKMQGKPKGKDADAKSAGRTCSEGGEASRKSKEEIFLWRLAKVKLPVPPKSDFRFAQRAEL